MYALKHVERSATIDQKAHIGRLSEPGGLVQGRSVIKSRCHKISSRVDEHSNRVDVISTRHVGKETVFFRIARFCTIRMLCQYCPGFAEVFCAQRHRKSVCGHTGAVRTAASQQVTYFSESTPRGMDVCGLAIPRTGVNICTEVQQDGQRQSAVGGG